MQGSSAHDVIKLYQRHALQWDADRQKSPWNDRAWHEQFVRQLPPGGKVLDLGCGSGHPVARFLADQGIRVTGVDSSPTMIALCQDRLPAHQWIVKDMRRLALGRRFDGILAWDSIFHLVHDDQRRMFTVFDEHAGSDALLMFNTGPQHGEAIGAFRGEPLYHASLAPMEYEVLLDGIGFNVIKHIANDAGSGGRTIWLCRRKELSRGEF